MATEILWHCGIYDVNKKNPCWVSKVTDDTLRRWRGGVFVFNFPASLPGLPCPCVPATKAVIVNVNTTLATFLLCEWQLFFPQPGPSWKDNPGTHIHTVWCNIHCICHHCVPDEFFCSFPLVSTQPQLLSDFFHSFSCWGKGFYLFLRGEGVEAEHSVTLGTCWRHTMSQKGSSTLLMCCLASPVTQGSFLQFLGCSLEESNSTKLPSAG